MRSIGVLFLQGMALAQFSAVDMTKAWFWQRQQSGRGELNLRRVELQVFRQQRRMNVCWSKPSEGERSGSKRGSVVNGDRLFGSTSGHNIGTHDSIGRTSSH